MMIARVGETACDIELPGEAAADAEACVLVTLPADGLIVAQVGNRLLHLEIPLLYVFPQ